MSLVRLGWSRIVANFGANPLHFSSSWGNNRRDFSWSWEAAAFINWHTVAYTLHLLPDWQFTANLFLCSALIHRHFSAAHTCYTHTLGTALFLKGATLPRVSQAPTQRLSHISEQRWTEVPKRYWFLNEWIFGVIFGIKKNFFFGLALVLVGLAGRYNYKGNTRLTSL